MYQPHGSRSIVRPLRTSATFIWDEIIENLTGRLHYHKHGRKIQATNLLPNKHTMRAEDLFQFIIKSQTNVTLRLKIIPFKRWFRKIYNINSDLLKAIPYRFVSPKIKSIFIIEIQAGHSNRSVNYNHDYFDWKWVSYFVQMKDDLIDFCCCRVWNGMECTWTH